MKQYKFSLVNQDSLAIFSFVQLLGGELVATESALTESEIGFIDMLIDIPLQKSAYFEKLMRSMGVDEAYLKPV